MHLGCQMRSTHSSRKSPTHCCPQSGHLLTPTTHAYLSSQIQVSMAYLPSKLWTGQPEFANGWSLIRLVEFFNLQEKNLEVRSSLTFLRILKEHIILLARHRITVMKHTSLFINSLFCLILWSCANEKKGPEEALSLTDSMREETSASIGNQFSLPSADSSLADQSTKIDSPRQLKHIVMPRHDNRKFQKMTIRIVDSLSVTPGAITRLHPEDKALFDRFFSSGKQLTPVWDPKTGKTLPFPYAFPTRYAADIRRLDSIKAADSIRRKR